MKHLRYGTFLAASPLLTLMAAVSVSVPARAQPVQPPTPAEAQAALNPAPASFTNAQLDQMLAPIALYPDQLLTELLMAATFPQQVVDAGKWLQDSHNAGLKGDGLVAALQPLPWDPSIKSLVAFPQIIVMMNDHLDWTEALGVAFASQEVQAMARVQFLRDRAMAAGQLKTTPQLAVRREETDIIIEPTDPAEIYVPVYNPAVVYGDWPDRDAPPVFIPPPPGFYRGEIGGPGIAFSVGFGVAAPLWGWGHPDWRRHEVVVDPQRFIQITSETVDANNHIEIRNNSWHRTAPVAFVPQAGRPRPAGGEAAHPPGTVSSAAIRAPASGGGPAARPGGAAHPAEAGPHPEPGRNEAAHPAEAGPHPGPGPGGPPHPAEAGPHPGPGTGSPPHPAEAVPHPGPGPSEAAHPAEAGPHPEPGPVGPPHPAEAGPHPGPGPSEAAHPAEAGPHPGPEPGGAPHPAEAAPHPGPGPSEAAHPGPVLGSPPHPTEAVPHPGRGPGEAAHPAEAGPRPGSTPGGPPHPAEAAPHPGPGPSGPPHPAPGPGGPHPDHPGEDKGGPDQH